MNVQRIVLLGLVLLIALLPAACVNAHALAAENTPTPTPRPTATSTPTPRSQPTAVQSASQSLPAAPAEKAAPLTPVGQPLDRTLNLLILGSDRRPFQGDWRTDVLMLIALDLENGQAGAISLPRDIFLEEIPGHKPNKINVVDFLGEQDEAGSGAYFLASLLEEKIHVPIHHFLRFDFEGFKQVVDALGGVEIAIDCRAYEYLLEEDIALYLEPGNHRLDGRTALAYVRSRNQGGDLERARRQQRVVWAVRHQLLSENQIPHLPALYAALRNAVQTDIGFIDALRLARFALSLQEEEVHGIVISPPDLVRPDWRQGMAVFLPDWPGIAERVQTIFDRPPLLETNTVGAGGDQPQCP